MARCGQLLATFAGGAVKYSYPDHLSTRVEADSTGAVLRRVGHLPFGDPWYEGLYQTQSGTGETSKWKFTSYERDAATDTYYAIFRNSSWRHGRFLQADKLAGTLTDPQSLNRFSYVNNDPINYVDPSGQTGISAMLGCLLDANGNCGANFLPPGFGQLSPDIAAEESRHLSIINTGFDPEFPTRNGWRRNGEGCYFNPLGEDRSICGPELLSEEADVASMFHLSNFLTPLQQLASDCDVVIAARRAWSRSSNGASTNHTEAGFWVTTGKSKIKNAPDTNESGKISLPVNAPMGTTAFFHTHPNTSLPTPSAADRNYSNRIGAPVFTISSRGLFAYDSQTGNVYLVFSSLAKWLSSCDKPKNAK